jgi:outer membrane protein
VEVLESRRQWIQARTDYARSRYDYMVNVIKLQQAAGILSEQTLNRLNALLKDAPPSDAPGADAPGAAAPSPQSATP